MEALKDVMERVVAQLSCPHCRSAYDEIGARDPMPAKFDAQRCQCGAVTSFRYPDPTDDTGERWIRKRVER